MEAISTTNVSNTFALAAYSTQQNNAVRPRDRDNVSVDAANSAQPRRADNVSFSNEALRLSAQPFEQEFNNQAVNRQNETESTNGQRQQQQNYAVNPEAARGDSARTVSQAINAYRSTSLIS